MNSVRPASVLANRPLQNGDPAYNDQTIPGADLVSTWVRKQMQGMRSASELLNPTGTQVNANDERFALAA